MYGSIVCLLGVSSRFRARQAGSWPLLELTLIDRVVATLQHPVQLRNAELGARKLHDDEPGADHVGDVMELVSVADAVQGSIDCEREKKDVGDVSESKGSLVFRCRTASISRPTGTVFVVSWSHQSKILRGERKALLIRHYGAMRKA